MLELGGSSRLPPGEELLPPTGMRVAEGGRVPKGPSPGLVLVLFPMAAAPTPDPRCPGARVSPTAPWALRAGFPQWVLRVACIKNTWEPCSWEPPGPPESQAVSAGMEF